MKMTMVPIVIVALGTVSKGLVQGLEGLKIKGPSETIQSTTLLCSKTKKSPGEIRRLTVT